MNFDASIKLILKNEGGFSDNPLDMGGPTNLGITLTMMSRYLGRQAMVDDIKALTPESVAPIYKSLFWDEMNFDKVDSFQATGMIFDQAVLNGQYTAVTTAQGVLGIPKDGKVGPQTIYALSSVNEVQFCLSFAEAMGAHYIATCKANPVQMTFLGGWIARLFESLKVCLAT